MEDTFKLSVFHPTDFSKPSSLAFVHALKLSLICGKKLTIMHTGSRDTPHRDWHKFPRVRDTLEKWGILEKGSRRSSVFDRLGLKVIKKDEHKMDPVAAIMCHLSKHPTDLVVLGTSGRRCRPNYIPFNVAGPIINGAKIDTLFFPEGTHGFVSHENGSAVLRRILVPIARESNPEAAIRGAAALGDIMGGGDTEITVLHVGDTESVPVVELPERNQCAWNWITRSGEIADTIISTSKEISADLIIMTTTKDGGYFKTEGSSITQKVLKNASCPVLANVS